MTESNRIAREYKSLTTNKNVAPVDENLYARSLRNRDIPYDIRTSALVLCKAGYAKWELARG